MKESLTEHLNESLTSSWHGLSLRELIKGLSLEEARSRPLAHRHTIWEIVDHVTFWLDVCTRVLQGGDHPGVGELDDWPAMGSTAEDWNRSVKQVEEAHKRLEEAVLGFDRDFKEKVAENDFSYAWMIRGVCNHNLYHSGQVIILRASNP